jgi:hypothetical protein
MGSPIVAKACSASQFRISVPILTLPMGLVPVNPWTGPVGLRILRILRDFALLAGALELLTTKNEVRLTIPLLGLDRNGRVLAPGLGRCALAFKTAMIAANSTTALVIAESFVAEDGAFAPNPLTIVPSDLLTESEKDLWVFLWVYDLESKETFFRESGEALADSNNHTSQPQFLHGRVPDDEVFRIPQDIDPQLFEEILLPSGSADPGLLARPWPILKIVLAWTIIDKFRHCCIRAV